VFSKIDLNMFLKLIFKIWKKNLSIFILRLSGLLFSLTFIIVILIYLVNENRQVYNIGNKNNIYRILIQHTDNLVINALSPFALKTVVLKKIPEINNCFRLTSLTNVYLKNRTDFIRENNFYFADEEIFNDFNIKLRYGNFNASDSKLKIALSQKIVKKYFGNTNPLGKRIILKYGERIIPVKIVAIFENNRHNTLIQADIIGSFSTWFALTNNEKYKNNFITDLTTHSYFTTFISTNKNGLDKSLIEKKINKIFKNYSSESKFIIRLQSVNNIYFHSAGLINNFFPSGSITNFRLFIFICLLVFFITIANFIIISTAVHIYRKKEYFIRIVNGATRRDIFMLIWRELFLLVTISLVLSFIGSIYLLQYSNYIFNKTILIDYFIVFKIIVFLLLVFTCIVIIFSLLINHNLIQINKQKKYFHFKSLEFINIDKLIVYSEILIFNNLITVLVIVFSQWNYLKSNNALGYNPDNLLVLDISPEMKDKCGAIINLLNVNPNINSITDAFNLPLFGPYTSSVVYDMNDYAKTYQMERMSVGNDFFSTFEIKIIKGRPFDFKGAYDKDNAVIINESAVKLLGLNDPVGKKVQWREVIGVVNNFKTHNMYEKVAPLIIYPENQNFNYLILKYTGNRSKIVKFVKEKLKGLFPYTIPDLQDYKSIFNSTYSKEKRLFIIYLILTIIAIFLGVFGFIGLLIFLIQKRNKEIVLRRMNGASYLNICFIISKKFLYILLISNIVTYPLVYYLANKWIESFTYHIIIDIKPFLVGTIFSALIITSLVFIIVFNNFKQNPVNFLNR